MNCNKKMCVAGIAAFGTHAGSTQRRELGSGQFPGFGNGVAHGLPIYERLESELAALKAKEDMMERARVRAARFIQEHSIKK